MRVQLGSRVRKFIDHEQAQNEKQTATRPILFFEVVTCFGVCQSLPSY